MHPENMPLFTPELNVEREVEGIRSAVDSVRNGHPFLTARLWFDRSKRQGRVGEFAGRVVSLQISFESLLFATWTMTMVDQMTPASRIRTALTEYRPFEILFKTTMPRTLGGN